MRLAFPPAGFRGLVLAAALAALPGPAGAQDAAAPAAEAAAPGTAGSETAGFKTADSETAAPAAGDEAFAALVGRLDAGSSGEAEQAITALVAQNDPRAAAVLTAMEAGALYALKSDGRIVVGEKAGRDLAVTDAATGEAVGTIPSRDAEKVRVNNRLRGTLRAALGQLAIGSPDPAVRLEAVGTLARDRSPETAQRLRAALDAEQDASVRAAMQAVLAQAELSSDDPAVRLAAVATLAQSSAPELRALLAQRLQQNADGSYVEPDEGVRAAARAALDSVERRLAFVGTALMLFQGVSLGSVLLLAAIGLAITFGVMGVINLAHGEMIMLGAYATFVVQEAFRAYAPDLAGAYLVVSIPVAFLVAGAVGVVLERGVIRFLYGRPLETLLATWGISLVLQQFVRTVFGAPNREVANPAWMTGAFEPVPGLVLTANRVCIILFSLAVLALVAAVLRWTGFGLRMRAVTQNRPMASVMGIRAGWVDALTFGLGSGIAGIAGVALSQIGNVSPNLGQAYIVDSFMVVVFGGVGSLWGVLVAAMSLGIVNKVLEPYAGAMLGKILILVLVILFIQRRPRGLFALRGRAAEV